MIIGHEKQWQFLKKASEMKKLPHALLFSGQEKIGKKTLALELGNYLCGSSVEKHPDLILIEPEKEKIQIFQIRDLISRLSFKPYSASLKIGIIDKAHTMTFEAQSSFLKLLEEPKGDTLLILITEYPETLLSTITSRVQIMRFSPVKKELIEKYLLKKGISKKKAEKLTSISLGRPGRVIDFLSDPQKLEEREKIIDDLFKLKNSFLSERFKYAKELSKERRKAEEVFSLWLEHLRKILITKENSFENLSSFIKELQTIRFLLYTTNISCKLAIENLLIHL